MEEAKGFVSAKDALAALEQYQGCFFPHSAAVKIINQLSREDVEPVRHGEWVHHYYDSGEPIDDKWYCSECHACNNHKRTWYCPHCGAKMDRGN